MSGPFDPMLVLLCGLLLWPTAKALTLVGAAVVSIWSRRQATRDEARRLVQAMMDHSPEDWHG